MFPAPPTSLPSWLVSGLALGVVASVVVAAVFALGERYIPAPNRTGRRNGGPGQQRAEIREVFDAADEPYLEDYDLGAATVAFYLPDRDVAITFDARAYLRLADGPVHVVLCEQGVPGATIGRRLPFDLGVDAGGRRTGTGQRGRGAGSGPGWRDAGSGPGWRGADSGPGWRGAGRGPSGSRAGPRGGQRVGTQRGEAIDAAFGFLGLGRDADEDAVQSAYRAKVKELHPDQGGSREEFERLQEAYSIAKEYAG